MMPVVSTKRERRVQSQERKALLKMRRRLNAEAQTWHSSYVHAQLAAGLKVVDFLLDPRRSVDPLAMLAGVEAMLDHPKTHRMTPGGGVEIDFRRHA
jgi:hypothetical protein